MPPERNHCFRQQVPLTEETGQKRNQCGADQSNTAACHKLLHALRLGTGVVIAVALKQVDCTPDAETSSECDDECLKNGYCAIEKCHKCVPPCTFAPFGR